MDQDAGEPASWALALSLISGVTTAQFLSPFSGAQGPRYKMGGGVT